MIAEIKIPTSYFQPSSISVFLRKLKADCATSEDMPSGCLSALWILKHEERRREW